MANLVHSITGGITATRIDVMEDFDAATTRCTIETDDARGADVGDLLTVSFGLDTATTKFHGYIKAITRDRLSARITMHLEDVLCRATEYWFVPEDLDNPWSRSNINAVDLVDDILNECGLSLYDWDSCSFTFATGEKDVELSLTSAWDAIQWICEITGFSVYADTDGHVYFKNISPTPSGSPVDTYTTGDGGNILSLEYSRSDDLLRNKVVVFGRPPIKAEASASSPYVPSGFYKTAIISHEMIDTQAMAQATADLNLTRLNRLTEIARVKVIGGDVHIRDTVRITEGFSGLSNEDFFVRSLTHSFDTGLGYVMQITGVK